MPATVFAANESSIMLNGTPVDGVRAVEYRHQQARSNVYALGSSERIAIVSGPAFVEGRVTVASTSLAFDGISGDSPFQIIAQLRHGDTTVTATFDGCQMMEKVFELGTGGHGEATYTFSAERVREEVAPAAAPAG
ncbi:MAG TPA: hypothetical protein VGJ77_20135 [Gaiellaceae bacterium]